MVMLLDTIRTRLLPALVVAMGVVLVTAGLLSWADPATAGTAVQSPSIGTFAPTEAPSATLALPSAPSSAEPTASDEPGATLGTRAVATRVVIPALNIDLPVISGNDGYPYCNVAMYISELSQPGENRATYLYAHARDGMFGPIYERAILQNRPDRLKNLMVMVYTADNRLYLFEVHDVRLHQLDLDAARAATSEELWLQTSEGPKGTPGKTQLRALLLSVGAADPGDAHPKARPVHCG